VARLKKHLHLLPWLLLLSQHLHLHLHLQLPTLLLLLLTPLLLLLALLPTPLPPLLPSNWIQSKKGHLRVAFFWPVYGYPRLFSPRRRAVRNW